MPNEPHAVVDGGFEASTLNDSANVPPDTAASWARFRFSWAEPSVLCTMDSERDWRCIRRTARLRLEGHHGPVERGGRSHYARRGLQLAEPALSSAAARDRAAAVLPPAVAG